MSGLEMIMPTTVNQFYGYPHKPKLDIEAARQSNYFTDVTDPVFWEVVEKTYDYTLLPIETMYSLYETVRYVCSQQIAGDFVECGVFLGGAVMIRAETISRLGYDYRTIYLYDTFEGFNTQRTAEDDIVIESGQPEGWFTAPNWRSMVEENLNLTSYPTEHLMIVEGDIEKTAPVCPSSAIAILRLDTDTYYTTRAELQSLYPRLVNGGVLIIDDYGYAYGARRAVTEFFADQFQPFLHRINRYARVTVKMGPNPQARRVVEEKRTTQWFDTSRWRGGSLLSRIPSRLRKALRGKG